MLKKLYEWLYTRVGGRPWTYIIRDWVKVHPVLFRLIVGGSIAGFVAWMTFVLHIQELW